MVQVLTMSTLPYRYLIKNTLLYAVFEPDNGTLVCFERGHFRIPLELSCEMRFKPKFLYDLPLFNVPIREFTVEDCFRLAEAMAEDATYKFGTYSRDIKLPNADSSFKICYTLNQYPHVPIVAKCPFTMDNYRIKPKNFMVYRPNETVYISPTIYQYQLLKSVDHPLVTYDVNYDYSHENDYYDYD